MAFRADEAIQRGYEEAEAYLIPRGQDVDQSVREHSKQVLAQIVDEIGPAVDSYPSWHPLVSKHDGRYPITTPGKECGYKGLDHTRYFAHGFITCPYGDGQEVIDSVEALPDHPVAYIKAERIDAKLYHPRATPILVKCTWDIPTSKVNQKDLSTKTIPLAVAMPLLLSQELPCWEWADVAETWETMRPYFLGSPHGARSSLFVSQETGQAMKRIWNSIINTGMFGPIKV